MIKLLKPASRHQKAWQHSTLKKYVRYMGHKGQSGNHPGEGPSVSVHCTVKTGLAESQLYPKPTPQTPLFFAA